MPDTKPKRSPRKRATAYAILALLAFLFLSLTFGWTDVVFRPWARSITGAPVLVDEWVGQMPVPGAADRPVLLTLQRVPENLGRGVCSGCARIEGTISVCGGETYPIRGDVGNWRGTVFSLNPAAPFRASGATYTDLGQIKGEWDQGDVIFLRATPHPIVINSDGSSTVSSDGSSNVEVTFQLRRLVSGQSIPCG